MNPFFLLARLVDFYALVLLAYVILGWVVMASRGGTVYEIYRALAGVCEPYLSIFRRFIPPLSMGASALDLSPFIGWIVLRWISALIRGLG